jgi:hypothetical protein
MFFTGLCLAIVLGSAFYFMKIKPDRFEMTKAPNGVNLRVDKQTGKVSRYNPTTGKWYETQDHEAR